ncbi:MAG: hypothetical protein VX938_09380, partial [Myxococcota bacterium]|nr:hypothetical protein [Myxococcota bacterium]
FAAAIAEQGWPVSKVVVRFGLMSLGDDVEGQDWTFDEVEALETRIYTGGTWSLLLDGHPIVGGDMPPLHLFLNYQAQADGGNLCMDDQLSALTEPALPEDLQDLTGEDTPPDVAAAALAFIEDVNALGSIAMAFDSIEPAGQTEFSSDGRVGAVFNISAMHLH